MYYTQSVMLNRPLRLMQVLLLQVCILFCGYANAVEGADDANYRLGHGDLVNVQVFQEQDLSLTETISSNGTIDYPLIGELKLSGLTLVEAEALLDKALRGDYLINPQIRVSVEKFRPFFITGAVKSPGSYEYVPGMTAMQAIVIAGGFTERASKRKVFLIRDNDPTYTQKKVKLNEKVNAGDTINVKEALF